MKRLPVGIQTFRDIVQNDYLYVDKTEKIFDLVNNPKGVYFLSRPRRFGKSLLISTLNEIFEGEKELFKDLWIYNVTTGQETSQNHRLKTSQSDQRAHLCVLCCLTKHINPFRDFKTKICGAPIIK